MDFRSENVTVAAREIIAALDAKTLERNLLQRWWPANGRTKYSAG